MIRIGIVAPAMAMRAGVRAMLNFEIAHQAASLDNLESFISSMDVLIVTEDAFSSAMLRQALSPADGQVALLLLTDDPLLAGGLPDLPTRAWGILPLDVSAEELDTAVRAVYEGLLVGSPALLEPSLRRFLLAVASDQMDAIEPLTERESQVLQLLAQGLANKQIAHQLSISEHTVKFHVSSIYTKLGVANRTEAVRLGIQMGLVAL